MEIYRYSQPQKSVPGKWIPVEDGNIMMKVNTSGQFYQMKEQEPRIKIKGKWVKK